MKLLQSALLAVECAENKLNEQFKALDKIAYVNQLKVLNAFQDEGVQLRHFNQTSGYGYDDTGRDTLNRIYAKVFNAEAALVSPLIVSGTHCLTLALFGLLRPGDTMLGISGNPYDTLNEVINGKNNGSLNDFGIKYRQIDLNNGEFNIEQITQIVESDKSIKLIFIGRSRGYEWRDALSINQIESVIKLIRAIKKDIIIMVDNCYGEFIDTREPIEVGADVAVGSLIKNPGGGLVSTGGYICGNAKAIEQISYRMTAPSIGSEVGSYSGGYRLFYQGLFMAPHITMNAVKGSMLMGQVFNDLGYETMPSPNTLPKDIIRSIKFKTAEELIDFCRNIQAASPVDSNVVPYPWDMPGYENKVIMAAGTFVQGASIELSADSPIKEPYIAYLQGGLTYEHVKIATVACISSILNKV